MKSKMKPYLVAYRYGDREWNVKIMAESFPDARARIAQLALGRVEGELVATVPDAFGPFAALFTFLRNAFRGIGL